MMRRIDRTFLLYLALFVAGLIGSEAWAHRPSIVSGPPPPASGMPMPAPYKSQHAEEDFSALKDPAKRTDLFDPLKYIPLLGKDDWVLSLGEKHGNGMNISIIATLEPALKIATGICSSDICSLVTYI